MIIILLLSQVNFEIIKITSYIKGLKGHKGLSKTTNI